jgi:formylglycine-generating enzyme required for sulfatase activity
MGSPGYETDRQPSETLHEVTLTKGFWLGKYEVTQAQWESLPKSNPSWFPGPDNPVDSVSWNDVQDFLLILNVNTSGGTYRLPTEAEWEYAYRAGTTHRFYWGDDPPLETEIDNNAWYLEISSDMTHPVGQKEPNGWGLYDMSGNVEEWCQDWYGDYPAGPVTDPQGPGSDTVRVRRGGSWEDFPRFCRAAARTNGTLDTRSYDFGFRLLRTQD